MNYPEKYRDIAETLWADLGKGPLFSKSGKLIKHTALSGGERLIHEVAAAIGEPENHRMPLLDDLCHRISSSWQKKILQSLAAMLLHRS